MAARNKLQVQPNADNAFDPANLPPTLTPIPHITGPLDTSGTNTDIKEHEQIDLLLNYTAANPTYFVPDAIENPPENNVTEEDAHGTGDQAGSVEDLDKDTVAGTPLSDGYKDPADQLENQSKTDVDSTGTPLGGEAANVEDSHEDGEALPYTFDEVYPSVGETDDELDLTSSDEAEEQKNLEEEDVTKSPVVAGSQTTNEDVKKS